jgi:serine/threonine protein kinase/tetratricopeptide (TPR) repeat protein
MDGARWRRIQTLFHEAAGLGGGEQRAFVEAACGEDAGLAADVLAMLEEDSRGGSLLDRDVADVAQRMVGQGAVYPFCAKEIGPYRIRKVLGEGGMGVVYLAEREDLGSLAAIKILRDAWLSPARRDRFLSEQRTLAQLNHPSIARLYDADTLDDGTPWFAMEYVDGAPLSEYCRARGAPIRERLRLFRAVCEAVQHAHRHAIIHRDLKPSNILVKADGTPRLLDFGIAKQLENLDEPADQTRTGLRLMTPAYAAPEQIRGDRVGVYTDVYSLGVILYELLTGRAPFDLSQRTPGEAEKIILEEEAEKPSAVNGKSGARAVWADLDVLCLTAMHKDAQRRYRSVEALIRDIDHYLNGEPLEARPDSLRYRLGKFAGRNRRTLAAAGLALAVTIALAVFFTIRLAAERNRALAEAARTQRIQNFMLSLFDGGDQEAGPADSLRVTVLLERGVQEARLLDAQPDVQAELYQTLGTIYQKLGKLDQADALLRSALERRKAVYGQEHRQVADSLLALGLLRVDQARLDEAERLVRQGLGMLRRNLPVDHADVARGRAALGRVLEHRGAYDQAIGELEEAVRLQSAPGGAPADLASSMSELANTQFYAGRYAISDSLNRRVLAMHRQIYGARHPLIADDLMNLSAIQFNLGHYAEAEAFARQALDINRSWYGGEHPETASSLTFLGQALVRENRYGEALELLRQALGIQERVYGPVHPRTASVVNELGSVALKAGDLDGAEARFRRLVEIYRAVYGDRHYTVGIALSNLASVYLERKQYARAEPLFQQALEIYGKTLPADHLNVGITRIKLGRTLLRQARHREAESESLAGYNILMKQASPSVSWVRSAREDLAAVYDALHEPEKAAKFRTEPAAGRK